MKKVSILCFDLSTNCFGRSYILAELLGSSFEVELLGHSSKEGVWSPCSDLDSDTKPVRLKGYSLPGLLIHFFGNLRKIDGDVVVVCKPLLSTVIYGVVLSLFMKKKVVLDIDDDEIGLYREEGFLRRNIKAVARLLSPRSYYWALLSALLLPAFKHRTVASRRLQKKYGGLLVYHARKPELLMSGEGCCEAHEGIFTGLRGKKTVLFLGTPRPHKGLGVLSKAVGHLNRSDLHMIVVGCTDPLEVKNGLSQHIPADNLTCIGMIPLNHIGCLMSKADIVAIPQQGSSGGAEQTPAKIFDAMCFGKAAITTAVADITDIIGNSGIVIQEPSDYRAMAEGLERLLDDGTRRSYEKKAAIRFAEKFSFKKTSETLVDYINRC